MGPRENPFASLELYLSSGGFVMPVLVLITIALWYAIGYRWVLLDRGTQKSVRVMLGGVDRGKKLPRRGIVPAALREGLDLSERHHKDLRERLDLAFYEHEMAIKRYSKVVSTLVGVAPLLGLLGTVIGMITTFESLGDMTLFSQSGGIAGGISTALFTTQMGLIVAVPGVIARSILDRRQRQIHLDLAQIKDLLCSEVADQAGVETT
ncbi:MAG: MotA/TolQ/ExbB proton channel family protein [Xanthomonadales bacterium]|nr:MotA/TolQ/ExbB proton channel family protein [Xanthomonadales bacterium]